jgi:hypothetical protein
VAEIFERQVVLFIDLLGFSETAYQSDLKLQSNVLALLNDFKHLNQRAKWVYFTGKLREPVSKLPVGGS